MNISERVYWLTLISLFFIIAALIWFVFIPYQLLEYNLAVNLFTSSIFTVLTIVFISWLFSLREKAEWHAVRNEVFFRIKIELLTLFGMSVDYFEGGPELKTALMLEKDKTKNVELVANGLKNLGLSQMKKDNYTVMNFFKESNEIESFLNTDKRISDIQGIYSKHLPADITASLMKLQHYVWALDSLRKFHGSFNNLAVTSNALFLAFTDTYENVRVEMLKTPLLNILEEIHKLHSIKDLKFSYPPL